jgi:hypothetical protein
MGEFMADRRVYDGNVVFTVAYSDTEGNRNIDSRFVEFCKAYSDNKYLLGIQMLLDAFERLKDRVSMENYVKMLELRIIDLESSVVKDTPQKELFKEDKGERKTF